MPTNPLTDQWRIVSAGKTRGGTTILMTWYMKRWWNGTVAHLGFRPQISQGAFRNRQGGGASASAGTHDLGGCIDISLRGVTDQERERIIWVCRKRGAAAYHRTRADGFAEEHIHLILLVDRPLSRVAQQQAREYVEGGDGLVGGRRDRHRRPDPLVTVPATPPFPGSFKAGARGKHVIALQRGLGVPRTGVYDAATVRAVKSWKRRHGWTAPTSTIGPVSYWGITPR